MPWSPPRQGSVLMSDKVARWTGSVEPHENGGFVAYGDYLRLLEQLERPPTARAAEHCQGFDNLKFENHLMRRALDEISMVPGTKGERAALRLAVSIARSALASLDRLANGDPPSTRQCDHRWSDPSKGAPPARKGHEGI